jgi:hypothetical protein
MGKNKQVTISINENELNAFENFVMCWNTCNKHKGLDMTEKDFALAVVTCPNCIKMTNRKQRISINVMCRLFRAYEKAMNRTITKENQ